MESDSRAIRKESQEGQSELLVMQEQRLFGMIADHDGMYSM